jgi:hypothetical protein
MAIDRSPRTCQGCGYKFTPAGPDQLYCSQHCESRAVLAALYDVPRQPPGQEAARLTLVALASLKR